jgi:ParB family transcriptional regulator, chromosome partitioning protein
MRALNPDVVKELAKSFEEVGQLQPIVVKMGCHGFEIVAGVHRLEAARKLNWSVIKATMIEGDDDHYLEAELAENCRSSRGS